MHHSRNPSPYSNSHYQQQTTTQHQNARKAEPYFCDRQLFQSLVRDAKVTEFFGQDNARPGKKMEPIQ